MKTILITGCSSGFGLETARYFLERDWKVIATMRSPREDALPASEQLRVLPLDVTNPESIVRLVQEAGPIDVLVNNAGVGLLSVFQGTPLESVRGVFETNTFGAMALCRAFLPQFTEKKSGVLVNVSSTVTLRPLPLLATYTASKAALNAFTECLALELAPFDVRVRLVLPGQCRETPFGQNARAMMEATGVSIPEAYADFARGVFERVSSGVSALSTNAIDVAEAVWRAANDTQCPLRLPAGADAVEWARG
ncbi:MAG: SDR family oxidoreductase [Polyangiaceae bacterium]|nr:SDR family oxidoreductase [Polyangiaceae bacterium]MCB9606857.1 SDR family oxidoreductase [Polyangiaceae bacterium]